MGGGGAIKLSCTCANACGYIRYFSIEFPRLPVHSLLACAHVLATALKYFCFESVGLSGCPMDVLVIHFVVALSFTYRLLLRGFLLCLCCYGWVEPFGGGLVHLQLSPRSTVSPGLPGLIIQFFS